MFLLSLRAHCPLLMYETFYNVSWIQLIESAVEFCCILTHSPTVRLIK